MTAFATFPSALPFANNLAFASVDVDELEGFLDKGDLLEKRRLTLLDKAQTVNAHLSQARFTHLEMFGVHLGANVIARSVPLRVAQILIPMQGSVIDRTQGGEIIADSGRAAIFHMPDAPVEVQWQEHTSALVVRIPSAYIKAIYETLTDNEIPMDFQLQADIDLTNGHGLSVMNIVRNLIALSNRGGEQAQKQRLTGLWEELLVTTLLTSDPLTSEKVSHRKRAVPVYGYVKRTTDYILKNIRKPFGIDELVQQSGVSVRTLQNGFRKTHELGPMAFVRQKKLNGIYRELLRSDGSATKISELARQWGFEHASHFTRIYKNQFDELPSATLAKGVSNTRICVQDNLNNVVK
ncbi:MAG: helix-turn-helix domain-containing protein [Gammaproteobacteria bacterium]|nr:helix-turn-helix domain-containing protein [Gammaproteobacteria bacterium]